MLFYGLLPILFFNERVWKILGKGIKKWQSISTLA